MPVRLYQSGWENYYEKAFMRRTIGFDPFWGHRVHTVDNFASAWRSGVRSTFTQDGFFSVEAIKIFYQPDCNIRFFLARFSWHTARQVWTDKITGLLRKNSIIRPTTGALEDALIYLINDESLKTNEVLFIRGVTHILLREKGECSTYREFFSQLHSTH